MILIERTIIVWKTSIEGGDTLQFFDLQVIQLDLKSRKGGEQMLDFSASRYRPENVQCCLLHE
jgi:hypothetical protein